MHVNVQSKPTRTGSDGSPGGMHT